MLAQQQHWLRGGFPRAFLARNEPASQLWREEFVGTFLARDLPQLLAESDFVTLHLPAMPSTHKIINAEKLSISPKKAKNHTDICGVSAARCAKRSVQRYPNLFHFVHQALLFERQRKALCGPHRTDGVRAGWTYANSEHVEDRQGRGAKHQAGPAACWGA